ncbi:MAG: transposase, partial [Bacteroidota bacterium]
PFHPGDLFKLLLFGYRNGMRSGTKLAKACIYNLEVKWLINDLRPSPRTINYFRSNNATAIINANKYFVQILRDWKMIDGKLLAVDSTKIDGQNSLKNNFNEKKIKRHLDYLDQKIDDINDQLNQEALKNHNKRNYTDKELDLADQLENAVDRKEFYKEVSEQVQDAEDGQVSLTDPDAKAVIVKRNIVKVGYSIQATVDDKNKMVIDVFNGGVNDMNDLGRAAKRAQHILDKKHFDLLADAGYNNGAEIAYTERLGVRPFVAPRRNHQQSLPGFRKEDFLYDKSSDTYTCPAGEILEPILFFTKGSLKRPYKVKRYATLNCDVCPLKKLCTTNCSQMKSQTKQTRILFFTKSFFPNKV